MRERIRKLAADAQARIWLLLIVAVAVVVARQTTITMPADTAEYLSNGPTRPPIFPLLADILRLLSPGHFIRLIVVLQAIFASLAASGCARVLGRRLRLGPWATAPLIVLLLPIVRWSCYVGSDTIGYGFFLLAVTAIVEFAYDSSEERLVRPFFWTALAILTRGQFLFALPVLLAGLAVVAWRRRPSWKKIAIIVALIAAPTLLQRAYNLAFNGRFALAPNQGLQLMVMTTYVSTSQDAASLSDEQERRFMTMVYQKAHERRLLNEDKELGIPTSIHLYSKYVALGYEIICPIWSELFSTTVFKPAEGMRNLDLAQIRELDRFTMRVSLHLLKRVWPRYARVVATDCWQHWDLFGLFCFCVLAAAGWKLLVAREPLSAVLAIVVLLGAANTVLIGMVESFTPRYTFPTDSVLFATLLAAWLHLAGVPADVRNRG